MLVQYELTGTLETESPLHIGSGEGGGVIDQPLLRDGMNRLVIPGTSLAGAVKTAIQLDPDIRKGESGGVASEISFCDCPAQEFPVCEIVTRNSINRATGTVAYHHLHSMELVPAGTKFSFRALTHITEPDSPVSHKIQLLQDKLSAGEISLGKGVTSGRGNIRLKESKLIRHDFSASGILAALKGNSPAAPRLSDKNSEFLTDHAEALNITVAFTARGPLFSGVEQQGKAADIVPLTRVVADKDKGQVIRFLLPGTSIKGVLRSRAELIARTVTDTEVDNDFLAQITKSGLDAVNHLFGFSAPGSSRAQRGALIVKDVLSQTCVEKHAYDQLIETPRFAGEPKKYADFIQLLDRVNKKLHTTASPSDRSCLRYVTRTAIDRFTGNALNGALYSILEPTVDWQPMRLSLDLAFLKKITGDCSDDASKNRYLASLSLVLLLLIDMSDGLFSFGARTTHGAGAVEVDRADILLQENGRPEESVHAILNKGSKLLDTSLEQLLDDADFIGALDDEWQRYISHATITGEEEK